MPPFDLAMSQAETVRFLEQACGAGVFSIDLSTHEVTISAGLGGMIGLAAEQRTYGLGRIAQMIHPADRLSPQEALAVLDYGGARRRGLRIITPFGNMRWLNVQYETLVDMSGNPSRIVGIISDATMLREDDGNWLKQRDRLRSVVMGVAPIIWSSRADGQMSEMMGWESVTGMRDSKALGADWIEAIHVDDRNPMLAQWSHALERKVVCDSEVRVIQADGGFRWFRAYSVPRFQKSGSLRNWSGMAIDVHTQMVARRLVARNIVTGVQIRASRAILRWSVQDLCKASGLTPAVIRRLESTDGALPRPTAALDAVAAALRKAGVEFVFDDDKEPGVRPS